MKTDETFLKAIRLGVVLLAAGASRRMGRPKMLLPWCNTSILGHLIYQWRKLGAEQTAVVHACNDPLLIQEMDRLSFPFSLRIPNFAPEEGMFGSIQCAARWNGWHTGLTHWAIVLGDQPHLSLATLSILLAFAAANPGKITQPAYSARARHPVIMPNTVFRTLASAAEPTLKDFLQTYRGEVVYCAIDDPSLAIDIDRPIDYTRALRFAQLTPASKLAEEQLAD